MDITEKENILNPPESPFENVVCAPKNINFQRGTSSELQSE